MIGPRSTSFATGPKLLFLIMAHDRPDQAAELGRLLVGAAQDGAALIHFDARAPAPEFAALQAAVADEPRIRLVAKRVACRWGSFGLVEAPLNALAEAEAAGLAPDYVVLLSGACLPCRPIRQLERYLAEHSGREFIEVEDASWIGNGWRQERWQYRFWFDHKTQHPAEWLFFHAQRLLGLTRRFPDGLTPRFGSQWWALTWDTCQAILRDIRRDPRRLAFFRSVWIPDEMVFQTYVHALVPAAEIAGFGLTHFQFSNRGKPVVYYDDHTDYVGTLNHFFLRKIWPGAARLRAECRRRALAPDDGAPLDAIGTRRSDYLVKVAAQTHYPVPGQMFYRDQQADMTDTVLAPLATPYVVLLGPPALTARLAARLSGPFTVLGEVFAPGAVDLGSRPELGGLGRGDVAVRDMHPALYLARLRARCALPVLRWSPLHAPELLAAVLRDPVALVVACLPMTGDAGRDRQILALASDPGLAVPGTLPGIAPEAAFRARVDRLVGEEDWLSWLGDDVFYAGRTERVAPKSLVPMPWAPDDFAPAERRALFEAALHGCRFAAFDWYRELARALRRGWEDLEDPLGPLPEPAAAAIGALAGVPALPALARDAS
jgi:hypothetical protein